MNVSHVVRFVLLILIMTLFAGCDGGSGSGAASNSALSANNINLIFVVSPDLINQAAGDVDPITANLTSQGLQRYLLMATYLKQQVIGSKNVTGIYALEPMTHLQTINKYPDMAGLMAIQQFAMLNQITLSASPGSTTYTGNSYPINVSYNPGSIPPGVFLPQQPCPGCQGLDFNDEAGNLALATGIINANVPGFYVFSAPWTTTSRLLDNINRQQGYNLPVPVSYAGPNQIYSISISPTGSASLKTFNSNLNPPSTYPVLSPPPQGLGSCTAASFSITATGGVNGVVVPAGINRSETMYIVRHAEAHPTNFFGDGNYVAAGQWRALNLPNALRGKINPTQVYSTDPSQVTVGSVDSFGNNLWSNVAPALTVQPYAIANNLPYNLVSGFLISAPNSPQLTSDFFFTGGKFTGQSVLLGWQFAQIPQTITALLNSYNYSGPPVPAWSGLDYDSVWTVKIDANGNLTVDNSLCQGIDSSLLPVAAPQF